MPPKQASVGAPPKELTPLEKYGFPATLFVLSAAVSPISQLTLAPVYGALPSAVNHTIALAFACAIGFGSWILDGSPRRSQHIWITVFPFWVPFLQTLLLPHSKALGPVTGAIFNGAVSCHAILVASIYALAEALAVFDLAPHVGPRVGDTAKAALLIPAFMGMEKKVAGWVTMLLSNSKVLTPVHLQAALASAYALYFPSWYLLLGLPGLYHTFMMNPHINHATVDTALSAHNWTLVDRQWSTTGYVSVLDSFNEQYRVMRCDHSLLGGEWLLTEERKKEGWKVNEPIYSAFEMLEAVRLMHTKPEVLDSSAQALVIGLGIGTAPKALVAHGINTTVVELDPVVHAFATQYFDLPQNHTAVLQDATTWVEQAASGAENQYDYIIHDVFTGGAEPLALFNAHFLRNLKSMLKPHGAIAINYAGDLVNPVTQNVLHTIQHVFSPNDATSETCKIFRDGPPKTHALTEGSDEDFANMVVFCKNSNNNSPRSKSESFFRPARQSDYLGRQSAKEYLVPKPEFEIPFPDPGSPQLRQTPPRDIPEQKPVFQSLLQPLRALRDDPWTWYREAPKTHTHAPYTGAEAADLEVVELGGEGKFSRQQEESAVRHWYIMRTVLPDAVWELW